MNKVFLEYSKKKFNDEQLFKYRTFTNVSQYQWFKVILDSSLDTSALDTSLLDTSSVDTSSVDPKEYRKNLSKYLEENIKILFPNLNKYNFEIVYRYNQNNNYNMKWHIDNCIFQKHPIKNIELLHDLEIIGKDTKYVYCIWKYKKIPKYTMIIYLSNYMIDFQGGQLEFIDGMIIKPKIGDVVIFNSNEIHRVHTLKWGIRNCIVIKFY
jgi:hypothetical protein